MKTRTYRNAWDNWTTESVIEISDTMRLLVFTMKRHSGVLATTAQVQHKHRSENFYSYEPFKDYNKQLLTSNPARCTRQLVEAQHERVMQNLDVIIDAVENHYGLAV